MRSYIPQTGLALAALAIMASSPLAARGNVRQVTVPSQAEPAAEPATAPAPVARQAPTEKAELAVMVDRAKVIRLPEKTQMVVIGNPAIADLAIQKSGIVVVTGKSFGTTNLIALDAAGNMLAESTVSVTAPNDGTVVVQRGSERQTYSCTPNCQPSVALGDSSTYFSDNRTQAEARNQFATQQR